MKITDYANDRGNRCKEDRIGFGENYAYVMDGATGLTAGLIERYLSDTVWFVEHASDYLNKALTHDVTIDSDRLFQGLSNELHSKLRMHIDREDAFKEQLPSAAIILLRQMDETLVIESYGDCTAVVEYTNGCYEMIHDGRATELDRGIINHMQALVREEGITMREAKKKVYPLLLNNRQLKNKENGYTVMDITTDYIGKGLKHVFDYQDVQTVWLFSDGVDSYYTDLDLATDAIDMVKQIKKASVHQVIDQLRIREEADELCEKYPRMKPKDDASIIQIVCNHGKGVYK